MANPATPTKEDLKKQILSALSSGSPTAFSYHDIPLPENPGAVAVTTIEFEINQASSVSSPLMLSSLVSGTPLGNLVPTGSPVLKPLFEFIHISEVAFTLYPKDGSGTLGGLSCKLVLGPDGKGRSHPLIGNWQASLDSLALSVVSPTKSPDMNATIAGSLSIPKAQQSDQEQGQRSPGGAAAVTFDIQLQLPEILLTVTEKTGDLLSVGDLVHSLGGNPKAGNKIAQKFFELSLQDLTLTGDLTQESYSFHAVLVEGTNGQIPSPDKDIIKLGDVVALRSVELNSSYQQQTISAGFNAALVFGKGLQCSVGVQYSEPDITVRGRLDVAATLNNWARLSQAGDQLPVPQNAREEANTPAGVTLQALGKYEFDVEVPDALKELSIVGLDASYTTSGADHAYSFNGVVDGKWTVDGVDVKTDIALSIDKPLNGNQSASINCEFSLDGFILDLGYDFAAKDGTIGLPALGVAGDYHFATNTVDIKFTKEFKLETLLESLIGAFTGSPGFQFGQPWDTILSPFSIPANTEIDISIPTKTVTIKAPVDWPETLGCKVDSIEITYDPQNQIQLELNGAFPAVVTASGGTPSGGTNKLKWNPAEPGTAPTLPGMGSNVVNVQMIAMGQRINFQEVPQTVEDGIYVLIEALTDDGQQSTGSNTDLLPAATTSHSAPPIFPRKMVFNSDSAWLIGSKVTIMGQIVTELLFNDPQIYGAMIRVDKPADPSLGNAKLNAFAGLYFEVLYRKVSDTIGEYYAAVVLPPQFSSIDLGEVVVHLPSFSIAIYTNGNFELEIGFPYNADFSHSFGATYLVFTGLGGFYFGSLNGTTAKNLPAYVKEDWRANPVIEIGVGIAVGIQRGFIAGPMQAQLQLMLQTILQGTFVQFHRYNNPVKDSNGALYYKAKGQIRLVGQLTGEVNLAIISASFNVEVIFSATLILEEYEKSEVDLSATVDIRLSVKIGVGFFSFHIHVSFHHTISTSFEFGKKSIAPFSPKPALFLDSDPQPINPGNLVWTKIIFKAENTCTLDTYLVPQLTFADAVTGDTGQLPYYVNSLFLNNPDDQSGTTYVNDDPSFQNFAEGVLLWVLNAYLGDGKQRTREELLSDDQVFNKIDLDRINELLTTTDQPFDPDQLSAFTRAYFSLLILKPETKGNYGLCCFPMTVNLSAAGMSTLPMDSRTPLHLTTDYLASLPGHAQKQHHKKAPVTGFRSTVHADSTFADKIGHEYVLTVARNLIGQLQAGFGTGEKTIKDMIDSLAAKPGQPDQTAPAISGWTHCAGFVTNFLLHGLRKPDEEGSQSEPLFYLTGQQFPVTGDGDTLTVTVTSNPVTDNWNTSFKTGESLVISSADENPLVLSPKTVATLDFEFKPDVVKQGYQTLAETTPRQFVFSNGSTWQAAASEIWLLQKDLLKLVARGTDDTFSVEYGYRTSDAGAAQLTSIEALTPGEFDWLTTVDFTVRRVSAQGGGYLPATYELVNADSAGLGRLVELLSSDNPQDAVHAVRVGYRDDDGFKASATTNPFSFIQTNLSTESRPVNVDSRVMALSATTDQADVTFLAKLWAGGIVNSGGYYLYNNDQDAPLPDSLFDGDTATLTVLVELGSGATIPSYTNAIRTKTAPPPPPPPSSDAAEQEAVFFATSASIEACVANIPPGHLAIEIERKPPSDPAGKFDVAAGQTSYDENLDNLYTLVTGYISKVGDTTYSLPKNSAGVGHIHVKENTNLIYRQTLAIPDADVNDLKFPNPYQGVGETISYDVIWTDLYGNLLSTPKLDIPDCTGTYIDRVPSLGGLPNLTSCFLFSDTGGAPQLDLKFEFRESAYAYLAGQMDAINAAVAPYVDAEQWQAAATLDARVTLLHRLLDGGQLKPGEYAVVSDSADKIQSIAMKIYNDRELYAFFYFQLQRSDISLTLETSIKPGEGIKLSTDVLIANAKTCFNWLETLEQSLASDLSLVFAEPLALQTLSLTDAFAPDSVNDAYIFMLDMSVCIRRLANVDTVLNKVDSVHSSESLIPAQPDQWGQNIDPANPPAFTYLQFADKFRSAFGFAAMRIATGPVWEAGSPARDKQLWVMRYGKEGISPAVSGDAVAYAIAPIVNRLVSMPKTTIATYNKDSGKMDGEPRQVFRTNVDLDAEMKTVLAVIEKYLTPAYAVPASLVDNGTPLKEILDHKRSLVEQLVALVTNVQNGKSYRQEGDSALPAMLAAVEKLRQECLVTLNNFYEIDALASIPVTTTFTAAHSNPTPLIPVTNMFGQALLTGDDGNLSISSGKVSLTATPSQLAFSIKSHDPASSDQYSLKASFQPNAYEHDIVPVSSGGIKYKAGPWLTFIQTPKAAQDDIIEFECSIKIPLRNYPNSPNLVSQTYISTLADSVTPELAQLSCDSSRLQQAKEWDFQVNYQHRFVSQDHVYVRYQISELNTAFDTGQQKKTLIEVLTSFNENIDAIGEALEALKSKQVPATMKETLGSFAGLIEDIVNANWNVSAGTEPSSGPGIYKISEGLNPDTGKPAHKDDDFYINVGATEPGETLPQVIIPDLKFDETKPGWYRIMLDDNKALTVGEAHNYPNRQSTLQGLNIIDRQKGKGSLRIGRNEDMPECFRYETAFVSFPNSLLPHLDVDEWVPITESTDKQSIADQLKHALTEVLSRTGDDAPQQGGVKMVAYYAYTAQAVVVNPDADSTRWITPPVAMTLPREGTLSVSSSEIAEAIDQLSKEVNDWLNQNQPVWLDQPGDSQARLLIDLTVFSDNSTDGHPLLRLRKLYVSSSQIKLVTDS